MRGRVLFMLIAITIFSFIGYAGADLLTGPPADTNPAIVSNFSPTLDIVAVATDTGPPSEITAAVSPANLLNSIDNVGRDNLVTGIIALNTAKCIRTFSGTDPTATITIDVCSEAKETRRTKWPI